jgi:hypothetical protein
MGLRIAWRAGAVNRPAGPGLIVFIEAVFWSALQAGVAGAVFAWAVA